MSRSGSDAAVACCEECFGRGFSTWSALRRHRSSDDHRSRSSASAGARGTSSSTPVQVGVPLSAGVGAPPPSADMCRSTASRALPLRVNAVFVADVALLPQVFVSVPDSEACPQFDCNTLVEAAAIALDVVDNDGADVSPAVAFLEARSPGSSLAARVAAVEGIVVGSRSQVHRDALRLRAASRSSPPSLEEGDRLSPYDRVFADAVAATLPPSPSVDPGMFVPRDVLPDVCTFIDSPLSPDAVGSLGIVPAPRLSVASADDLESAYDELLAILGDVSEG